MKSLAWPGLDLFDEYCKLLIQRRVGTSDALRRLAGDLMVPFAVPHPRGLMDQESPEAGTIPQVVRLPYRLPDVSA